MSVQDSVNVKLIREGTLNGATLFRIDGTNVFVQMNDQQIAECNITPLDALKVIAALVHASISRPSISGSSISGAGNGGQPPTAGAVVPHNSQATTGPVVAYLAGQQGNSVAYSPGTGPLPAVNPPGSDPVPVPPVPVPPVPVPPILHGLSESNAVRPYLTNDDAGQDGTVLTMEDAKRISVLWADAAPQMRASITEAVARCSLPVLHDIRDGLIAGLRLSVANLLASKLAGQSGYVPAEIAGLVPDLLSEEEKNKYLNATETSASMTKTPPSLVDNSTPEQAESMYPKARYSGNDHFLSKLGITGEKEQK